jgi:hypothetical protein
MKTHPSFRRLSVCIALIALLALAAPAAAAPPPPVPISPTGNAPIVIPTFSWQAAGGAATYELEVGPQSDLNTVYWSAETENLALTPASSADFPNEPLYWRVRGVDAGAVAGAWSDKETFTKHIPAPTLVSPAEDSPIIRPTLEWQPVEGATYYQVELSHSDTFISIEATYTTYNTRLTPVSPLDHGKHYWRVSGVDAAGHVGDAASRSFTKQIPPPTLVSPTDRELHVHVPVLQWQAVEGATYYKVELSFSDTFVPVEETYTTYNTSVTPVNTITHGLYYWRVSGVDAAGHVGAASATSSFTKGIDPPPLVAPANDATITVPTMEWSAVDGASYYKIELSTAETFIPVVATYTTHNLRITPLDALSPGVYYWRVSGVDAGGHAGDYSHRRFTFDALPGGTELVPQLGDPAHEATIDTDPTFTWSLVTGADHYRLVVSKYADFHATYDNAYCDYNEYTPSEEGSQDAYVNGAYYWKVEARNAGNVVIATSEGRSFTKNQPLPLVAPADGVTGLTVDPTFQWDPIVGADRYRLIVSKYADFHSTYDNAYCDYNEFTPYNGGSQDVYTNGAYYWKVEALNHNNAVITTSEARGFTKEEPLPLVAPADGVTGLTVDPTFQWDPVVGADRYRLIVSKYADFHATNDNAYCDYNEFTPYNGGSQDVYANGAYYWKVEALNHNNAVITTSEARGFTKEEPLPLVAPADGAVLFVDPTFRWNWIVGADHYHLFVSKYADFHATYDNVYSDYNRYTPYEAGSQTHYRPGVYYWKVEALNHNGAVLTTSSAWDFTIDWPEKLYLPLALRGG